MLLLELAVLLLCIVVGARLGGIALGTLSGIGLLVFVLGFGMPPGNPPAVVLGMILAVITALSMMEAAGGLTFLVETAEKLLHRNPARITVIAPLVTYALIFAAGSGFVAAGLSSIFGEHIPAWFWVLAVAAIFTTLWLNLKGKLDTKKTLWFLLAEMLLIGGIAFLGGQLMHFGWAVFHLLVITLQAFIFMMLTIVYLSMAHEHH